MNKYVAQLLEVIQKKTGCDTSGAVRWLANQAGGVGKNGMVLETAGETEKGNGKEPRQNSRRIEKMSEMPHAMPLNVAGRPVFLV